MNDKCSVIYGPLLEGKIADHVRDDKEVETGQEDERLGNHGQTRAWCFLEKITWNCEKRMVKIYKSDRRMFDNEVAAYQRLNHIVVTYRKKRHRIAPRMHHAIWCGTEGYIVLDWIRPAKILGKYYNRIHDFSSHFVNLFMKKLHAMHKAGVIHGDTGARNVLIQEDKKGHPKDVWFIDFGESSVFPPGEAPLDAQQYDFNQLENSAFDESLEEEEDDQQPLLFKRLIEEKNNVGT